MNKLVKILVLVVSLILIVNSEKDKTHKISLLNHDRLNIHWSDFKLKHNKKYLNPIHESLRKQVFNSSIARINELNDQYNKGIISFVSGINQFSDMTSKEFLDFVQKSGLKMTNETDNINGLEFEVKSLPDSIDWRTKGVVNPIKDQNPCGACWAFAAVASLESAAALKSKQLQSLSEQNLLDCVYDHDTCTLGGHFVTAFKYIKKNNGIDSETSYPYNAKWSGSCRYKSDDKAYIKLTDYKRFRGEDSLKFALSNVGPVSVAIQATETFQHYSSGVFSDSSCRSGEMNHAVALVGYGSENGNDHYILRNSWGTWWGMNGYALFARNKNNMCDISTDCAYPIVD